jgi:hypothetical protein
MMPFDWRNSTNPDDVLIWAGDIILTLEEAERLLAELRKGIVYWLV